MSRKSISPKKRFAVLQRDKHTCTYCGAEAPDVKLEIDHMDAYDGGELDGEE